MPKLLVIVAARDEADRIGPTIEGLRSAFGDPEIWIADDASADATAAIAAAHGARVVTASAAVGKGGNVTGAARTALEASDAELALVCDGDLGESATALAGLVEAVSDGTCDLAVAAFRIRLGGGFGVALGFARWAIRSRSGYVATAPISGQRAMKVEVLRSVLPFAAGYGMEVGMSIDAVRAGFRLCEIELELEHRATGRTLGGFVHRARQLRDFARVWWSRR